MINCYFSGIHILGDIHRSFQDIYDNSLFVDIIMTTRGEDQMNFALKVTISRISEEWDLIIAHQWNIMDKDLQIITVHSIKKNLGTLKVLPSSPLPSQILVLRQLKNPLTFPNPPWTDH